MSRSRSFLIRDLLWGQDRRGAVETSGDGDELGLDLTTRPLGYSRATQCSDAHSAVASEQSLFPADSAAPSLLGPSDARRSTPLLRLTAAEDDAAAPGNRGAEKGRAGLCMCREEQREGCVCGGVAQSPQHTHGGIPQVPRVSAAGSHNPHDTPRRSPGPSVYQSLAYVAGGDSGGSGCGSGGGGGLSWRSHASPTPTPSPSTPPLQSPPISPSISRRRTPTPPTSSPLPALLPGFPPPVYGGSRGFLRPEKVLDVRHLLPLPGGRQQYGGGVPLMPPQHPHHHHYLWAARYSSLLSSLPLQGEQRIHENRTGQSRTK